MTKGGRGRRKTPTKEEEQKTTEHQVPPVVTPPSGADLPENPDNQQSNSPPPSDAATIGTASQQENNQTASNVTTGNQPETASNVTTENQPEAASNVTTETTNQPETASTTTTETNTVSQAEYTETSTFIHQNQIAKNLEKLIAQNGQETDDNTSTIAHDGDNRMDTITPFTPSSGPLPDMEGSPQISPQMAAIKLTESSETSENQSKPVLTVRSHASDSEGTAEMDDEVNIDLTAGDDTLSEDTQSTQMDINESTPENQNNPPRAGQRTVANQQNTNQGQNSQNPSGNAEAQNPTNTQGTTGEASNNPDVLQRIIGDAEIQYNHSPPPTPPPEVAVDQYETNDEAPARCFTTFINPSKTLGRKFGEPHTVLVVAHNEQVEASLNFLRYGEGNICNVVGVDVEAGQLNDAMNKPIKDSILRKEKDFWTKGSLPPNAQKFLKKEFFLTKTQGERHRAISIQISTIHGVVVIYDLPALGHGIPNLVVDFLNDKSMIKLYWDRSGDRAYLTRADPRIDMASPASYEYHIDVQPMGYINHKLEDNMKGVFKKDLPPEDAVKWSVHSLRPLSLFYNIGRNCWQPQSNRYMSFIAYAAQDSMLIDLMMGLHLRRRHNPINRENTNAVLNLIPEAIYQLNPDANVLMDQNPSMLLADIIRYNQAHLVDFLAFRNSKSYINRFACGIYRFVDTNVVPQQQNSITVGLSIIKVPRCLRIYYDQIERDLKYYKPRVTDPKTTRRVPQRVFDNSLWESEGYKRPPPPPLNRPQHPMTGKVQNTLPAKRGRSINKQDIHLTTREEKESVDDVPRSDQNHPGPQRAPYLPPPQGEYKQMGSRDSTQSPYPKTARYDNRTLSQGSTSSQVSLPSTQQPGPSNPQNMDFGPPNYFGPSTIPRGSQGPTTQNQVTPQMTYSDAVLNAAGATAARHPQYWPETDNEGNALTYVNSFKQQAELLAMYKKNIRVVDPQTNQIQNNPPQEGKPHHNFYQTGEAYYPTLNKPQPGTSTNMEESTKPKNTPHDPTVEYEDVDEEEWQTIESLQQQIAELKEKRETSEKVTLPQLYQLYHELARHCTTSTEEEALTFIFEKDLPPILKVELRDPTPPADIPDKPLEFEKQLEQIHREMLPGNISESIADALMQYHGAADTHENCRDAANAYHGILKETLNHIKEIKSELTVRANEVANEQKQFTAMCWEQHQNAKQNHSEVLLLQNIIKNSQDKIYNYHKALSPIMSLLNELLEGKVHFPLILPRKDQAMEPAQGTSPSCDVPPQALPQTSAPAPGEAQLPSNAPFPTSAPFPNKQAHVPTGGPFPKRAPTPGGAPFPMQAAQRAPSPQPPPNYFNSQQIIPKTGSAQHRARSGSMTATGGNASFQNVQKPQPFPRKSRTPKPNTQQPVASQAIQPQQNFLIQHHQQQNIPQIQQQPVQAVPVAPAAPAPIAQQAVVPGQAAFVPPVPTQTINQSVDRRLGELVTTEDLPFTPYRPYQLRLFAYYLLTFPTARINEAAIPIEIKTHINTILPSFVKNTLLTIYQDNHASKTVFDAARLMDVLNSFEQQFRAQIFTIYQQMTDVEYDAFIRYLAKKLIHRFLSQLRHAHAYFREACDETVATPMCNEALIEGRTSQINTAKVEAILAHLYAKDPSYWNNKDALYTMTNQISVTLNPSQSDLDEVIQLTNLLGPKTRAYINNALIQYRGLQEADWRAQGFQN